MTLFGIDVSHHQTGLSVAAAHDSGHKFVVAKATEGRSWKDTQFSTFRRQAEAAGLLFAGYHFLRSDSPVADQAVNAFNAVGSEVPLILDVERSGVSTPHMGHVEAFAKAYKGNLSQLLYYPEWYWLETRGNLNGWDLWESSYGVNDGVYPGDDSIKWTYKGGQAQVLQFTSAGRIPGYPGDVDRNAFRGTMTELVNSGWFINYGKDELDMATIEDVQRAVATAPIILDGAGRTEPLQKVLRMNLTRTQALQEQVTALAAEVEATKVAAQEDNYTGPAPWRIARAVVGALPVGSGVSEAQIEQAVANVLREGTNAKG